MEKIDRENFGCYRNVMYAYNEATETTQRSATAMASSPVKAAPVITA